MKTLNITFEDKEYKKLVREKNKINTSWHDFILQLVENNSNGGNEK